MTETPDVEVDMSIMASDEQKRCIFFQFACVCSVDRIKGKSKGKGKPDQKGKAKGKSDEKGKGKGDKGKTSWNSNGKGQSEPVEQWKRPWMVFEFE